MIVILYVNMQGIADNNIIVNFISHVTPFRFCFCSLSLPSSSLIALTCGIIEHNVTVMILFTSL